MSDEARRGRLIFLTLSALILLHPVIDTARAIRLGDFEDSGPFLGLILESVLLYRTYRGSTAARRLTVALLLLGGVINPLIAFRDVEHEGIMIDFRISPDLRLLALGAFALASAVLLVASRPVRSFLEFQRGGGAA